MFIPDLTRQKALADRADTEERAHMNRLQERYLQVRVQMRQLSIPGDKRLLVGLKVLLPTAACSRSAAERAFTKRWG
jgi:hypothetical protein